MKTTVTKLQRFVIDMADTMYCVTGRSSNLPKMRQDFIQYSCLKTEYRYLRLL